MWMLRHARGLVSRSRSRHDQVVGEDDDRITLDVSVASSFLFCILLSVLLVLDTFKEPKRCSFFFPHSPHLVLRSTFGLFGSLQEPRPPVATTPRICRSSPIENPAWDPTVPNCTRPFPVYLTSVTIFRLFCRLFIFSKD